MHLNAWDRTKRTYKNLLFKIYRYPYVCNGSNTRLVLPTELVFARFRGLQFSLFCSAKQTIFHSENFFNKFPKNYKIPLALKECYE